ACSSEAWMRRMREPDSTNAAAWALRQAGGKRDAIKRGIERRDAAFPCSNEMKSRCESRLTLIPCVPIIIRFPIPVRRNTDANHTKVEFRAGERGARWRVRLQSQRRAEENRRSAESSR